MTFGRDINASTDFDRTLYQLDLPDTKAQTLEQAFTLFADYAGGLLLRPESIAAGAEDGLREITQPVGGQIRVYGCDWGRSPPLLR